ncbi:MAG: hypothetical protein LAO77_16420 [Acidobacteriia bacterium]|nr:hypothetical protein [Terriglobia bacterium]
MFWWFERAGRFVRCAAQAVPGDGYELRIVSPDGTERVERFDASSELAKRQASLEREFLADGWTGPHGWNI